jgi:hypothetical protein
MRRQRERHRARGRVADPVAFGAEVAISIPDLVDPARTTDRHRNDERPPHDGAWPRLVYGGTWVSLEAKGRDLIREWIKRLRG